MDKRVSSPQNRLVELMREFKINQTEIANKTGLTNAVVSMYINGKRIPRQDKIISIAEAYNVDPSWLLGYDVPMFRTEILNDIDTDMLAEFIVDNSAKTLIECYRNMSETQKKRLISYANYLLMDED